MIDWIEITEDHKPPVGEQWLLFREKDQRVGFGLGYAAFQYLDTDLLVDYNGVDAPLHDDFTHYAYINEPEDLK